VPLLRECDNLMPPSQSETKQRRRVIDNLGGSPNNELYSYLLTVKQQQQQQ
jgi:dihydroxyacetone kinase